MDVDSKRQQIDDADIQDLLDKADGGPAAGTGSAAAQNADKQSSVESDTTSVEDRANQLLDDVDAGLNAAISGTPRQSKNVRSSLEDARPFEFADLGSDTDKTSDKSFSIGMLDDVQMSVQIELGRAELLIDEVLSMRKGVVVPLDKLAGDPIDIVVNGRLLARGEILVLNEKFCVRVVEIVASDS
jgi:flagellar motor switch protein FliN